MRPALRLAISNVSGRRSHHLLLVGAVALSAALITAVAAALNSLNASVNHRTQVTLGTADLRIQPTGSGQTFDQSLLETIRAWEEVELAAPKLQVSLPSVVIRKPVFEQVDGAWVLGEATFQTAAMGNGVDPQLEPLVRPLRLLAGRPARDAGEIVADGLLLERLGWAWHAEPDRQYGFGIATSRVVRDRLGSFSMPESIQTERVALRANSRQGARLGDDVLIMPRFVAVSGPFHLLQAVTGPNRALALFRFFGGTEGLMNTARFLVDRESRRAQIEFFRNPASLTIVGVAEQPPLGGRPQCYLSLGTLQELTDQEGQLSQVDIVLAEGFDAQMVAEARQRELGDSVIVQTTERVTSGLDKNIQSSQLGFVLASMLAFLSAAFIILTGMNTDIAQRQRELAILRCVGAGRGQIAQTQLYVGFLVGLAGALVGVPLGALVAFVIAQRFPEQLPSGLVLHPGSVVLAFGGAVFAGVGGAAIPAWRASRTSPMAAMRQRSVATRLRAVGLCGAIGLAFIATHLSLITFLPNAQATFWAYVTVALPSLFVGYFLLSVLAVVIVTRVLGRPLALALGLPRNVLARGVSATPYRYGFTAGAMMTGLAIMVAIWTNGRGVLRDWIGVMEFPDAFVSGVPLTAGASDAVNRLPFVVNSSAITREIVEVQGESSLGIQGLQRYSTSFIGFEPESFFEMTNITWVQGDPEVAKRRLVEPAPEGFDGTILVAREFLTARGKGVGDVFECSKNGENFRFEIVGVVTSPGLDVASRFFNIGEEYAYQAVHAVFSDMSVLREKFGSDQTHIIQVDLDDEVDDAFAVAALREALTPHGLLDVGSGRQVKERIAEFANGTLLVFTSVAIVAMLTACFGVANLIVAAVETRRFEFGVLRAVGAHRGMLLRLVLGEAMIIAITAAILGTLMGIQGSLGGRRVYEILLGIEFSVEPPLVPIAVGWVTVIGLTLLAAGPAAWRLNRREPRELLVSPT